MNVNDFYQIFVNFNWQTIVAMFSIGWYFTRDIKKGLVKLEEDVRKSNDRIDQTNIRIDSMAQRIDKTYTMFYDLLKEVKK